MQGTVQKVMTLTDGSVRFFVDVPLELAPDDIKSWMFENVVLLKETEVQAYGKQKSKETTHGKKKRKG